MNKEKKKISFSRISTFLRCPYEYKYTYLERKDGIRRCGVKIGLGISLHAALRDFYYIKNLENRTLNTLLKLLEKNWLSENFSSSQEELIWLKKGKEILTQYYLRNDHTKTPSYIEQKFKAEIDSLIFIGIIDRIDKIDDNHYEIIDYKLEDYLDNEIDNLQMSFYYLGCKHGLGIEAKRFTYYILETNEKKSISITPNRINEEINKIYSIISEIDSTDIFVPKINNLCENCGLKSSCPAYKDK